VMARAARKSWRAMAPMRPATAFARGTQFSGARS
jgi:hypothetical protein